MPCDFYVKEGRTSCQFDVSESDLIPFNEGSICKFHLPLKNKSREETEKAQWDTNSIKKFRDDIYLKIKWAVDKSQSIDMSGVVFPEKTNFNMGHGDVFPPGTNVEHVVKKSFNIKFCFQNAEFHDDIEFIDIVFRKGLDFREAVFKRTCSFKDIITHEHCSFEGSNFDGSVSFEESVFRTYAYFKNVKIKGKSNFKKVTFEKGASFENSKLEGEAIFFETKFMGPTRFKDVCFGSRANFSPPFKKNSEGSKLTQEAFRWITFENAEFHGHASFDNRHFLAKTNFGGCTFKKAPTFHECDLHQNTQFPPQKFFLDTSSEAASAYRKLKVEMENVRARQEEAMFYALEQKSRRNDSYTPKWVRFFSWMYEITSNYGQSLGRPLFWMVSIFFTFFYIYIGISDHFSEKPLTWKNLVSVFAFAIQQCVAPFQVWRIDCPDWLYEKAYFSYLQIVATLQSLLFLVFFGLFVLVLRWRFRRG